MTICAQGRDCLFGEIHGDCMVLNNAGLMLQKTWNAMPERFPCFELDAFVIMPNHVHFIVFNAGVPVVDTLIYNSVGANPCGRPDSNRDSGGHNHQHNQGGQNSGGHKPRPYGERVSDFVGAFKSITTHEYTIEVKQSGWPAFSGRLWQRNYYERVVRNEDELHGFREYIQYNPARWAEDEENSTQKPGTHKPGTHKGMPLQN